MTTDAKDPAKQQTMTDRSVLFASPTVLRKAGGLYAL